MRNRRTVSPELLGIFAFLTAMWVQIVPRALRHFTLSTFFILAILIAVWWNLILVIICISLMVNGIKHLFFNAYLPLYILSSEMSKFFNHLKLGGFVY